LWQAGLTGWKLDEKEGLSVKDDCQEVQDKRGSSFREIQITSKDPTETLDRRANRQDRHARQCCERTRKCNSEILDITTGETRNQKGNTDR
jgi:hypothetical protein